MVEGHLADDGDLSRKRQLLVGQRIVQTPGPSKLLENGTVSDPDLRPDWKLLSIWSHVASLGRPAESLDDEARSLLCERAVDLRIRKLGDVVGHDTVLEVHSVREL